MTVSPARVSVRSKPVCRSLSPMPTRLNTSTTESDPYAKSRMNLVANSSLASALSCLSTFGMSESGSWWFDDDDRELNSTSKENTDEVLLDRFSARSWIQHDRDRAGGAGRVSTGPHHARQARRLQSQRPQGQHPSQRRERDGRERQNADAVWLRRMDRVDEGNGHGRHDG